MRSAACLLSCFVLSLAATASAFAGTADDRGSQGDAEHAIQAYLTLWSSQAGVNEASVTRFYAPHVDYYGKEMSRAQVLADKLAYIRRWPIRDYREIPGSFAARCNIDRSRCSVKAAMTWSRTDVSGHRRHGMAKLSFVFVPVDGARKIARESAVLF